MRLQKYMAMCGVAARRKCEEIIAAGRVAVNGETITQMGTQVEDGDVVVIAAGVPLDTPGSTNLLKVEVVGRRD